MHCQLILLIKVTQAVVHSSSFHILHESRELQDWNLNDGTSPHKYIEILKKILIYITETETVFYSFKLLIIREQSLKMLQTGAEEILLGYETIF